MTTTWLTFRDTILRPMLKDDVGLQTNRWTNAELLTYANFGLDDLAMLAPRSTWDLVQGDGVTATFALPETSHALDYVTWLADDQLLIIEEYLPAPGDRRLPMPDDQAEREYLVDWPAAGLVTFTRAPAISDVVTLYCSSYWPHLVDVTSILPFGRAQWMELALVAYCAYLAHLREGVGRASLEQWSTKPENMVGNPLNLEAREWLLTYERIVRNAKTPSHVRTY